MAWQTCHQPEQPGHCILSTPQLSIVRQATPVIRILTPESSETKPCGLEHQHRAGKKNSEPSSS